MLTVSYNSYYNLYMDKKTKTLIEKAREIKRRSVYARRLDETAMRKELETISILAEEAVSVGEGY